MLALLWTLFGLALLDALNVLHVGVVSAIVYDGRLQRQSPIHGGLSYIAGVFTVMATFGICTVLGLSFLNELFDFTLTPTLRFRAELVLGVLLVGLAFLPLTAQTSAPGWALAAMRKHPSLLGILGGAVGLGQAPTAVPYLTGLAMLATFEPRPLAWPLVVITYCAIALLPPLVILALSVRKTARSARIHRMLVRALTRYGPTAVRVVFVIAGIGLVADALIHHSQLL
jgi:cytochrome c biogenesis protein CcdA